MNLAQMNLINFAFENRNAISFFRASGNSLTFRLSPELAKKEASTLAFWEKSWGVRVTWNHSVVLEW